MQTNRTKNLVAMALALSLAAGTTTGVMAAEKGVAGLVTARDAGGTTLAVPGAAAFRTTQAAVSNARLVTLKGSPTVVAVWDETSPTGSTQHYYAISRDGRSFPLIQTTGNQILLDYARFDPTAGAPAVPAQLKAGPNNELHIVQFVGTPLDEMRAEIRAMGGVIERWLPENAHVVRMPAGAAGKVAGLPYVRAVTAYEPAYRMSEETRMEALLGGDAPVRYSIETMRAGPAQQQALADLIRRMGGIVDVLTPDQYRLEATLTAQQLLAVAQRNEVNYIDMWGGPGGPDMDIIRQVGGAVPVLSGVNFLGQGVRGEIFDTGVVPNHQQWNGQVPLTHNTTALDSHGNACYGINFATGTGNAQATGLMPQREQGIFCYYNNTSQFGGGPTRLALNTEATDPNGNFRSVFQTSSVGSARVMTYTTISAEVDDYLFRVDYLSLQSQSNAGGSRDSRPQAWAKNILSVGGLDLRETVSRTDDIWASGASVGPADDLRVKPDLSHSFDQVFSTYSTSTTGYGQFNGTSSATPCTAGHAGLLHQMWHEGVWPGFGGASTVFASRPRSTTAKALMINGAYRNAATAGNNLYRARVGWGMVDLGNLYTNRAKTFIVNESDVVLNGETKTYNITVLPGEAEFRVTMIFSDPQGNPAAAQDRINDLTLKVIAPDSTVYWGNNGMVATAISGAGQSVGANFTVPGGSANTVDTVENVFVQNPAPGSWTVEVIASQVVQDARLETPGVTDADFALVAMGGTAGPPPPLLISLPSGLPALVAPGTPTDIPVRIMPGSQTVQPGTEQLRYRFSNSGSFLTAPMVSLGGENYRATLPGAACGDTPQFYFTATGNLGGVVNNPGNAPTGFHTTQVGTVQQSTLMNVDFDTALPAGWAGTGLWHVTAACPPGGTACAGPQAAYYGQDASCNYATGNTANTGTLTAPPVQLPPMPPNGAMSLSFCSALITENAASYDKATVLINGAEVLRVPESASWQTREINLAQYAGQTINIAFKFESVDGVNNTFRGWHIDSVKVIASTVGCQTSCYANCDGSTTPPILNVNDFICFQTKYAAGDPTANCDGSTTPPILNVNDFICFQTRYAQGCP